MTSTYRCDDIKEQMSAYLAKRLPLDELIAFRAHITVCKSCRQSLKEYLAIQDLLQGVVKKDAISPELAQKTTGWLEAVSPQSLREYTQAQRASETPDSWLYSLRERLKGAPWWGVSVALHVLVILLASLISMSMTLPKNDDVVMMTQLEQALSVQAEVEKPKSDSKSALESKHDTPPTDPTAQNESDIVVPPDILAKAEIGDHFETINLDRPDTHSAFGNPDSHFFYSVKGNDEPEGGGGQGGMSGLEDVIGIGGAASKGSGGGWGGGNGTGIGVGNGPGKGSFGNRNGGGRRLMVMRHGGSKATENAVDKALEWLARHQEADGRWSVLKTDGNGDCGTCDPGVTGLALLAFLGAGHTEKVGQYKSNVQNAVAWIISQQRADGAIGTDDKWKEHHGGYGYHHAICGLALAEAAGMGRVPATIAAAQKAVDYSCNQYQYGEGSDKLGWRYAPKAAEADVSVSGWYIMQLKSAKIAGLHVDPMSFQGALNFLASREQDPATVKKEDEGYDNGRHRYGYTDRGAMVNTTAIGCLCQLFCGVKPDEVRGSAMWLLRVDPPAWKAELGLANAGGWPLYYTYYTTLLMFQVGGDQWKQWNNGMKKMLLDNQRKDGDASGSWDSLSDWEKKAGRTYATALGVLSLEVYYRYAVLDNK